MIKKIEHFWKGLSSDRTQISALPPDQYGDRFYRFVEGVTMSSEQAQRKALVEAEAEATRLATAVEEPAEEVSDCSRVCPPWKSHHRNSSAAAPPMPTYAPPLPPVAHLPPNVEMTNEKFPADGELNEKGHGSGGASSHIHDGGESAHGQSLPVVDEAAEGSVTGSRSFRSARSNQSRNGDEERPPTPAKDSRPATPPVKSVPRKREGPPTPPKYMKPETADSGYGGVNGVGNDSREGSLKLTRKVSRESLDKDLPPLPRSEQAISLSVG